MSQILDQLARQVDGFRPKSVREVFALQLARKLDDVQDVRRYVLLVDQHPQDMILQAYRRAVGAPRIDGSPAARFLDELERTAQRRGHGGV